MIDRAWMKTVIEAARSVLWGVEDSTSGIWEDEFVEFAGVRPPRTEAERLLLIGVVSDMRNPQGGAQHHNRDDRKVNAALVYLREHARDPRLTRSIVARKLGLSDSWLAHRLKQTTGHSFDEHVNNTRFEDVCAQLRRSSHSIKHLALTAGFPSAGACSKQFQRRLGMSPSQWRTAERAGRRTQDAGRRKEV